MCAVLDLVYNKGIRLSYALYVACMILTFGSVTRGPCCVFTLFTNDVPNFM